MSGLGWYFVSFAATSVVIASFVLGFLAAGGRSG